MFYFLSKTFDMFVAPLTWALILVSIGAWAARRGRRKLATAAPISALAVLYVFGLPPVANRIVRHFEDDAETTASAASAYDVVIVLGGLASVVPPASVDAPELSQAADRITTAYDLLRSNRARYVLVTSSAGEPEGLGHLLESWGIAKERILLDTSSSNTRDNAVRSASIVRDRGFARVLLVTSALHMPRAAGCFRAAGVTFDTLAVDRVSHDPAYVQLTLIPRAAALAESTDAIREWTGRVVYRLMGYSK